MDSSRVEQISEGETLPDDLDAGERAIAKLVHKTVVAPTELVPTDLDGVRSAYGETGALDISAYIASFHFINRIADLVGIQSDFPIVQPRFAALRRFGVRLQGWSMGKLIDLSRRPVRLDVESVLAEVESVLGPLPAGIKAVEAAPNVAGYLQTVAQVVRRLDRDLLDRVSRLVVDALPRTEEEATGFHARPEEALEALVFVGTRYAARTTDKLVTAVREAYGYDDAALTDLFYAIAVRNGLERQFRLLAA